MKILFLLLLSSISTLSHTQSSLMPFSAILEYGPDRGSLMGDDLLYASLLASGVSEDRLPQYKAQFDELLQTFLHQDESNDLTISLPLGDRVLQFLHKSLFKRYVEIQTRVDVVLDRGTYNCVSSALIYMIFMNRLDVRPVGVATRDHAFCMVFQEDRWVDVETTNPFGWEPGVRKEFHDSFGNTTGFRYVPQTQMNNRRTLDERGLLGLLYQNLMADAQKARKNSLALSLAVDRHYLESSSQSFDSLIQGFQNEISDLNRTKKYSLGFSLAQEMFDRTSDTPQFRQALGALINNQVLAFLEKGQYSEIEDLLKFWEGKGLVEKGPTAALRENAQIHELQKRIDRSWTWEILQQILDSEAKGYLSQEKSGELQGIFYAKRAQDLSQTEGYRSAIEFMKTLPPDRVRRNPLKGLFDAFLYNFGVEVHNRFAQLYNQKEYQQAEAELKKGLEFAPGLKILVDAQKRFQSLRKNL